MLLAEQDPETNGFYLWCIMWTVIIIGLLIGLALTSTYKPKCWQKVVYDSGDGYATETACHRKRNHKGIHRDDEGFEWK